MKLPSKVNPYHLMGLLERFHPDVGERQILRLYGMDNTLYDFAGIVSGWVSLCDDTESEEGGSLVDRPCGEGANLEDAPREAVEPVRHGSRAKIRCPVPSRCPSESRTYDDDCPFEMEGLEVSDALFPWSSTVVCPMGSHHVAGRPSP